MRYLTFRFSTVNCAAAAPCNYDQIQPVLFFSERQVCACARGRSRLYLVIAWSETVRPINIAEWQRHITAPDVRVIIVGQISMVIATHR